MPTDRTRPDAPDHRMQPTTVAPNNRITVAFPFSTIKVNEPDPRVAALAALVAELASHLAATDSSPAVQDLRDRAHACAVELAS